MAERVLKLPVIAMGYKRKSSCLVFNRFQQEFIGFQPESGRFIFGYQGFGPYYRITLCHLLFPKKQSRFES